MSQFLAYRITCIPTEKVYIGITSQSLRKRWAQHLCHTVNQPTKLGRAMRKYGVSAFTVEPIACANDLSNLLILEIILIGQYNSKSHGLNSTRGGDGVYGIEFDDDAKARMSAARKALWSNPEYRAKVSASQKAAWARKSPVEIEERRTRARLTVEKYRASIVKIESPKIRRKKGWQNLEKTHCPSGHPYSEENVYINKKGARVCKTCKRAGRNVARDRRRAES